MTLSSFFADHPKAALGLSGGVDSAYLLYAGVRAGADIRPYFIKTCFQPRFEQEDAQRLCRELGVTLTVMELDVLAVPHVAENPENRCYYCKQALFGALRRQALADGCSVLLDGTNASDDASGRPGMRALEELAVLSPLRECGLTKAEIRRLSREAGLFVWDKPAYACLATRVPAGTALTAEQLERIETAEMALFGMGFSDFRVRLYYGAACLQVPPAQLSRAAAMAGEITARLEPLFGRVFLDLKGR